MSEQLPPEAREVMREVKERVEAAFIRGRPGRHGVAMVDGKVIGDVIQVEWAVNPQPIMWWQQDVRTHPLERVLLGDGKLRWGWPDHPDPDRLGWYRTRADAMRALKRRNRTHVYGTGTVKW